MSAGRHRAFDVQVALDSAMELFWLNGYSGTSLTELTCAMGINKPSLYAAFGNKEELFKTVLTKYAQAYGELHAKALFATEMSLHDRIQAHLISMATMLTDPELPGGCLIANSICETGGDCLPTTIEQRLNEINVSTKSNLLAFFSKEHEQGNLTSTSSPELLTNTLITLQAGLAVMARNGANFQELEAIIALSVTLF